MSDTGTLADRLGKIQDYATSYFEVIYKTIFPFWLLPEVPAGGNILTGVFATALITVARAQMSQPIDAAVIASILGVTVFLVLLICGILIVFDPIFAKDPTAGEGTTRIKGLRQLVSVVCVCITLGCAFILLDRVFPWIGVMFAIADRLEWSAEGANRAVAIAAALLAGVVVFANTLYRVGPAAFFATMRMPIWTLITVGIVILGINVIVMTSQPLW